MRERERERIGRHVHHFTNTVNKSITSNTCHNSSSSGEEPHALSLVLTQIPQPNGSIFTAAGAYFTSWVISYAPNRTVMTFKCPEDLTTLYIELTQVQITGSC